MSVHVEQVGVARGRRNIGELRVFSVRPLVGSGSPILEALTLSSATAMLVLANGFGRNYVAERHEIEGRYAECELIAAPEIREACAW